MLRRILFIAPLWFALAGCTRYAYYFSPSTGNAHPYKTIPLVSDSIKKASYGGFFAAAGSSNDFSDEVYTGSASIHASHNLGTFQAYYGANLSLGAYRAIKYRTRTDDFVDTAYLNKKSGSKFFGTAGVTGGIDVVIPFGRAEWRVLGLEGTIQQEFGNYLNFRKSISPKIVNAINNSGFYPSLAVSTEFIGRGNHTAVGYKLSMNFALSKLYNEYPGYVNISQNTFVQTVVMDRHRASAYMQWFLGNGIMGIMMGVNYHLR